jgi:hypothetical protein
MARKLSTKQSDTAATKSVSGDQFPSGPPNSGGALLWMSSSSRDRNVTTPAGVARALTV